MHAVLHLRACFTHFNAQRQLMTCQMLKVTDIMPVTGSACAFTQFSTVFGGMLAGEAAVDPAWLMPFTLACLKSTAVDVQHLLEWGLLSLSLRMLASSDTCFRCVSSS
jgi:hypothetical protein